MKFTFPKLVWNSLSLFQNSFKHYKVIAFYALVMTAISLIFGQNYSCNMGNPAWWCPDLTTAMFFTDKFLMLCVIFAFFVDFYDIEFNSEIFSIRNIVSLKRSRLKKIGILFLLLLLIIVSFVIIFAMVAKEPNPNWKIEFIYFLIAFSCFWVPFVIVRLAGAVAYYLTNEKLPSLKAMWVQTTDKSFSIVFTYGVVLLVLNFITFQLNILLKVFLYKNFYFVTAVAVDFAANYIVCLYALMIMMIMRSQFEIFQPKNSSPSDENTAMDSQKNDITLPEAENDSSRVKKSAKKAKSGKSRKNKKEKK